MVKDGALCDGEAKAKAACLGGVEGGEDLAEEIGGDARAVILDDKDHGGLVGVVLLGLQDKGQFGAGLVGQSLDGITDEVLKGFTKGAGVAVDSGDGGV
jgi:hypothetical protein